MVKFFVNAYKELYVWFYYQTEVSALSFGISYFILSVLQCLNVASIILIIQKILGISLVPFLLTQRVLIALFVIVVLTLNYLLLKPVWKRAEILKDANNRAFAYILISLLVGGIAIAGGGVSS